MRSMRLLTGVAVVCGLALLAGCGDGFREPDTGAGRAGASGANGTTDTAAPSGGMAGSSGGDAGSGAGGESATTTSASTSTSTPVLDLFVDPVLGSDGALGTTEAPFQTLKHAFSVAVSGQTVWLGDGTYGAASGEDWTVPVPSGVTVSAAVKAHPVLVGGGTDAVALAFAGDGFARYLTIEGFGVAVSAVTGTQGLEGLVLEDDRVGLDVGGDALMGAAHLEIRNGGDLGFAVHGDAILYLSFSAIQDLGEPCLAETGVGAAGGAAQVFLNHLDVKHVTGSLRVGDGSKLSLSNSTFLDVGDVACGPGATLYVDGAAVADILGTIVSEPRAEALLAEPATTLTVGSTSFQGPVSGAAALVLRGASLTAGVVSVSGTAKSNVVLEQGASIEAKNLSIWGGGNCLRVTNSTVVLRSSTLGECTTGIHAAGASTLSLGSAEDPGGNTFGGVEGTVLRLEGPDIDTVDAAGNTWIPKVQGSGPFGIYAPGSGLLGPFGCGDPEPRNVCSDAASVDF